MFVYVIAQPGSPIVKIGRSSAHPEARFQAIRTMSPVPLALRAFWCTDELDYSAELELHMRFASRRMHGEWFDFEGVDPVAAVSRVLDLEPVEIANEAAERAPADSRELLPNGEPIWLTTEEAAEYTGDRLSRVEKDARSGCLLGHRDSRKGSWMFLRDDLDRWVKGETTKAGAAS